MTLLQIIPQAPGSLDGVGDYALILARELRDAHGHDTIFAARNFHYAANIGGFEVRPLRDAHQIKCDHVILHYVNYGFAKRGAPFRLISILRALRKQCAGRLVTVFHEIYASAPPWRSAFWLQPLQKMAARKIARSSDACIVSSEPMRDLLRELAREAIIAVHPVISTLDEPDLSAAQISARDPHRWVIFGGTNLVERSLYSFAARLREIPDAFAPRELFVLGGRENSATRDTLRELRGIACHYHPGIDARAASEILLSCGFSWIDYFQHRDVPTSTILKSGSFAACCAHGVISILAQGGGPISLHGDALPGPFFLSENHANMPSASDWQKISAEISAWYRRNAAVEHLAGGVVAALTKI